MKKTWKRGLALLLVFVMLAGMLPLHSFAGDEDAAGTDAAAEETVQEAAEAEAPEEEKVQMPEAAPVADEAVYPEDDTAPSEIVDVSSWDELEAAFNRSAPGKNLLIRLMKDLEMDGNTVARNATCLQDYVVEGTVTLDFNGHKLTGKLNVPNDADNRTYAFLRFYLFHGYDAPKDILSRYLEVDNYIATLIFDDSVGGGGVYFESSTYVDFPCMAVDVKVSSGSDAYKFKGEEKPENYNESYMGFGFRFYHRLIVNGGDFGLFTSINKFCKGSVSNFPAEDGELYSGSYYAVFMRSAFASKIHQTEINGGNFTATGKGSWKGADVASRELSALGIWEYNIPGLRINGGVFRSSGYAVKSYADYVCKQDERLRRFDGRTDREKMPYIRGGVFYGGICLTGKDFYYMDEGVDARDFSINRKISGTMLFDDACNIFINGKEKKAEDLKWEDLETKERIEVYDRQLDVVSEVYLDERSMDGKSSLTWTEGAALKIKAVAKELPEWVVKGTEEEEGVYLKNLFVIYPDGKPDEVVWSSEGQGRSHEAVYTPEAGGLYILSMTHTVYIDDRLILRNEADKWLIVEDSAIGEVVIDAGWECDDANGMTLKITGISDSVSCEETKLTLFNKAVDKVSPGDVVDISFKLKPAAGRVWGDSVHVIALGQWLVDYVEEEDGCRRYFIDDYTVTAPEGGLRLPEVILTMEEPAVGSKLPALSTSYSTGGPKAKWISDQPVSLLEVSWTKDGEAPADAADETVEMGHIYTLSATLKPAGAYHFTDAVKVIRSDSGRSKDVELPVRASDNGTIRVSESFAIPDENGKLPEQHVWVWEATAENHRQICALCNEVREEGPHSFGAWENYIDPDESTPGTEMRSCSECGFIEYRTNGEPYGDGLYVSFVNGDSFVYTGAKIRPEVKVMYRGEELAEGVDYTVKYKNNVKASEGAKKQPTVIVKGKTFAASTSRSFTITRKNIADADVIAEGLTVAKGKTAVPALYYGGKKIAKTGLDNPDAKKSFETDGTITVEGKGNFCGTRTIPVRVAEEKKISVTAFTPAERIYNAALQPLTAAELTVMSGSDTLAEGTDFAISYPADMAGAGTVKFTVVGIGAYSGSVSRSMKISPCTSGVTADVSGSVEYDPAGARALVEVYNGVLKLACGRDYTLKFSNNKAVTGTKPASVTIRFIGNYKGCAPITKEFSIAAYDLAVYGKVPQHADQIYTKAGRYLKTPTVEGKGKLLGAKDMEVSYRIGGQEVKPGDKITDEMMAGGSLVVELTVSGKGNYTGTVSSSFVIVKADKTQDLSRAKVRFDKKKYAFTGKGIRPAVTVELGGVTLTEGVDYSVEYLANVNKGKGVCIIRGLGDGGTGTKKYYGSRIAKFTITKGVLNWQ